MSKIDAYIRKCSGPTKPVVTYLRSLIHETLPAVEEQIKWGSPSFELNGKIVCQIMAFTKHVNFYFTSGKLFKDPYGLLTDIGEKSNMRGFKQISKIEDLPDAKKLKHYIKTAADHALSHKVA